MGVQSQAKVKAPREWTLVEVRFLRKHYRNYETRWLARQLGRTVPAVQRKARSLSLCKAHPTVWRGNRGPRNAFKEFVKLIGTTAMKRR